MKKKIIAGVLALIVVSSIGYFSLSKNNKRDTKNVSNAKVAQEFKVKSVFADVDMDMIVQDKDTKDDDNTGDYVFIAFNTDVADTKKNDGSNAFYIKNYKLDGKDLPDGSKIYVTNDQLSKITIKLPDGYLKGSNSSHSLEISKELKNKSGQTLKGELKVNLPYSIAETTNKENTSSDNNGKANNEEKKENNSNNTKAKADTSNGNKQAENINKDMPKYTIELGKAIPFTTVVAVRLDTKEPENYKVECDGLELKIKENDKGEKTFINAIQKEYELEQVKKLIKISKIK